MKHTDQVCSLELSMKLRQLYFDGKSNICPGKSMFYWDASNEIPRLLYYKEIANCNEKFLANDWDYFDAYTVAELGMMLPKGQHTYRGDNGWYVPPFNSIKDWNTEYPCENEADARAKLLIHLLENGLIKND